MSLIQKIAAVVFAAAVAVGGVAAVSSATDDSASELTAAIQHLDQELSKVKTDLATVEGDLAETHALMVAVLDETVSPFVFKAAPEELPTERRTFDISGATSEVTTIINACYGDTVRFTWGRPYLTNGISYLTRQRPSGPGHWRVNITPTARAYTPWSDTDLRPYLWTNRRNPDLLTHGAVTWRDCGFERPEASE